MKEEKTFVKINEKFWEEFSELEANEHYRRMKKLLNESRRVKVKLEED